MTTGWGELASPVTWVDSGDVFDVLIVVNQPPAEPATISADWDYQTPTTGNPAAPASGVIEHHSKALDELRVNKTPSAGGPADLSGLTPGDVIAAAGQRWTIQAIVDNTTYWTFTIGPNQIGTPDGVQTFDFETVVAVSIEYLSDTGWWTTNAPGGEIQGLYIADGAYDDIAVNGNAYGTDLVLQEVVASADWDVRLISGGGGSAGGGTGGAAILNELDDVDVTGAADGDLLGYNVTTSKWENTAATAGVSGSYPIVSSMIF